MYHGRLQSCHFCFWFPFNHFFLGTYTHFVYSLLTHPKGNPYYEDDEGVMCYNPAKNFQISQGHGGWYNNSYDTKTWNTGVNGGTSWSGKIIGIADYSNNPNSSPVVVKIESGQSTDLLLVSIEPRV